MWKLQFFIKEPSGSWGFASIGAKKMVSVTKKPYQCLSCTKFHQKMTFHELILKLTTMPSPVEKKKKKDKSKLRLKSTQK